MSLQDADLKRHRADLPDSRVEALLRKIQRLSSHVRTHPDFLLLENLCTWLKSPVSIWPANLDGIANHAMDTIVKGKRVDQKFALFLRFLPEPPSQSVCAQVIWHEKRVHRDKMDHLIRANHKFLFREEEIKCCGGLAEEWRLIKDLFDVQKYRNPNGLIRRQPAGEWRPDPPVEWNWRAEANQFFAIFNTFCYRWNLQGMLNNSPILSKTTIALTPFGTNIFIPAYWSLDSRRDLKWKAIRKLHRIRNPTKQGIKQGLNTRMRREEAKQALGFLKIAKDRDLKGLEADEWVMRKLKWDPRTDRSRLRRLLKLA